MPSESVSFRAPGQTNPAIFADKREYLGGNRVHGCFEQWAIALTLGGQCLWSTGPNTVLLQKGSLLVVRPHTSILWEIPENEIPWSVANAIFYPRPHWHDWLHNYEFRDGTAVVDCSDPHIFERLESEVLELHLAYSRSVEHRDEWTLLALERVLLTTHTHSVRQQHGLDSRVSAAIRYLHEHFDRPLDSEELAGAVYLSVSHLAMLFTDQIGVTPMRYLERLRLQRAAALLTFSSSPISQIANAVGYRDPEYFARRFQKETSQTPRAYRAAASRRQAGNDS